MTESLTSRQGHDAGEYRRFRSYLYLLARSHIGARRRALFDPSDIVQQTLLDAYERNDQFQGVTNSERMAWLKQILANNLVDAVRSLNRAKRDPSRERPLAFSQFDDSFARVEGWLNAVQSSPSHAAVRGEELLRLSDALTSLPQLHREAIVMHHLQGCSLAEVGEQLDKTPAAVAGLLHRGLKKLRKLLSSGDSSISASNHRSS